MNGRFPPLQLIGGEVTAAIFTSDEHAATMSAGVETNNEEMSSRLCVFFEPSIASYLATHSASLSLAPGLSSVHFRAFKIWDSSER
jgi:hypothetical protein